MTYELTKTVLDQIQDELSNYMDDLYEYRTDYSGRHMYEQQCIAWDHDESELRFGLALFQAIIEVAKADQESDNKLLQLARQEDWWELFSVISSGKSDSMGRHTVTYFPGLKFVEN